MTLTSRIPTLRRAGALALLGALLLGLASLAAGPLAQREALSEAADAERELLDRTRALGGISRIEGMSGGSASLLSGAMASEAADDLKARMLKAAPPDGMRVALIEERNEASDPDGLVRVRMTGIATGSSLRAFVSAMETSSPFLRIALLEASPKDPEPPAGAVQPLAVTVEVVGAYGRMAGR